MSERIIDRVHRELCEAGESIGGLGVRAQEQIDERRAPSLVAAASTGSGWTSWSKPDLARELRARMAHLYGQTDGSLKLPNSAEGDLLKIAWVLTTPNDGAET